MVIIGAPYDAGTSYRAGARFGPKMIRTTDYLPHDSSRPHLVLRVDPLQELRVVDAGDIEMAGVEGNAPLDALENAVRAAAEAGAIPLVLGGDHTRSPICRNRSPRHAPDSNSRRIGRP